MKNHEKEAFLKSFVLFFIVGLVFLFIAMYQHYYKKLHDYDMQIESQIMQCYLNSSCAAFDISPVVSIKNKKLHQLYKDKNMYILFKTKNGYKKIELPLETNIRNKKNIVWVITRELFVYFILLILFSIFFAYYTIKPFKNALKLNKEFVKDILHDFNTPVTSLKINLKILKKKYGENEAIDRSDEAIDNILSLQENLRYFLNKSRFQNEMINLKLLVKERIAYFHSIYPAIVFKNGIKNIDIYTNKIIFTRILDNIISNACKYNKRNGSIQISLIKKNLYIKDSGIGINNSKKIFERGYKEGKMGTGIGLHIVQKLCLDLNIPIKVKSTMSIGTVFILGLKSIVK